MVDSMLYNKQKTILRQIKDKSLLPLGTGTGKTLIALHYYINYYINKNLIIYCPLAKFIEGGWIKEIDRIRKYYNIPIKDPLVIPYSQVHKFNITSDAFVILDEAHYIKNPSAKRSKQIYKQIKGLPFIMLTATPGSKIEDYTHYFMLWGLYKYKTHFENEFLVKQLSSNYRNRYYETVVYKNIDKFNDIVLSHSTDRLTVNDVVELPSLIIKDVLLDPSKEYFKIKKDRVIQTNNENILLDTHIKLCTYLRQFVSSNNKIEKIKEIVEECKQNKENLLIFYNFKSELAELEKVLDVDYIINGNVKKFPLKDEFKDLQSKITLVQIQAGGTGIELQYNTQIVFYSPTYSYQNYEQALGRAYRPGQTKKVLVRQFNTIKTIESDVWQSLKNKKDFDERMWQ